MRQGAQWSCIAVNGLDIVAADARDEKDRPHGYGVYVLQGAFTLWNMQQDADVTISSDLVGLSAGRDGAPVRGSGIFVGGGGEQGWPTNRAAARNRCDLQ